MESSDELALDVPLNGELLGEIEELVESAGQVTVELVVGLESVVQSLEGLEREQVNNGRLRLLLLIVVDVLDELDEQVEQLETTRERLNARGVYETQPELVDVRRRHARRRRRR